MKEKEKDKLLLLYEETSNLTQESNFIGKKKINSLDSILNNKLNLVNNIIKEHNVDIQKFRNWINTINKNEKEIKQYFFQLKEVSNELESNFSLNQFEYNIQEKIIQGLNQQYNFLKTVQIREERQKHQIEDMTNNPINSSALFEKLKNMISFYENITGIRIEKDKNEKDEIIVHAFEGYNLLNDLKSCDFSIKLKNEKFFIVKMNPFFNAKPYEDEINEENLNLKNLGITIGKIVLNEFPQYVIT